jgi:hypothetical protein
MRAGHADASLVPVCPPRAASTSALVGDRAAVDHVRELPLERPHRFAAGLAFSERAAVVAPPGAVVAELGGRGVDDAVEVTVPALVEAMPVRIARGRADGGGAVL